MPIEEFIISVYVLVCEIYDDVTKGVPNEPLNQCIPSGLYDNYMHTGCKTAEHIFQPTSC